MAARAEALLALLLLLGVSTASVLAILPPVNVTVKCKNFENVLYWNYSASALPAYFNVNVYRYVSSPHTVGSCSNTTQHYCDISVETREVEEHYYATVTATVGSNVSSEADSTQFTYYNLFDGHLCAVDFPPVNVSFEEDKMVLSFQHPFRFYRKTLKHVKNKGEYKKFHFYIKYGNESTHQTFTCDLRSICEEEILIKDGVQVVHLWGQMNTMNLSTSKEIVVNLPRKERNSLMMLYLIPAIITLVLLIGGIGFPIYRKLTHSSTSIPKAMASLLSTSPRGASILSPERPNTVVVVQSTDSPSSETFLLPDGDCPPVDGAPKDGSRFPIGVGIDKDTSAGSGGSGSEAESSEANRSVSQAFVSGYDRPKQLGVEMAPGDTVFGYRD
ncbi:growth/differentiation factor 10b isoform X1 [Scleropages formosus]|uniref:growth/differentiation factor 10b isoform X1 n=1 Tax=Scleropages formosus TaxID=113540 RepID=UPI000878DF91|nr:interferon gamma receptor 1 isoform X1 [Scleropages formosus]